MSKKLLVVVLLLSAVAAVAATNDPNTQSATADPGIRTYLLPDLSFASVFSLDALLQPENLSQQNLSQPDPLPQPPRKRGTCRCSCGFPCATDRDCGGASCDAFISCCARTPQAPQASWFTRSFDSASHKTAQSEAILKEIVKAECK